MDQQLKGGDESWFSWRAVVVAPDSRATGWVNHYGGKETSHACHVGIELCEDALINRGLGTAALRLWVEPLFAVSGLHRLGLDTGSLNPRMIREAEKAGFVYEGCQRDTRRWHGEWLDVLRFGMLRDRWQRGR